MRGTYKAGILAEKIYTARKSMKITQEVLAEKLGITPQSVSRWENGQSRPDVDMLPRLAAFFGVTIDALFGYQAENLKIASYEEKHKKVTPQWTFATSQMAREILGFMPPIGQKNLLEIGCGDGQAAVFFARNGYMVSALGASEVGITKGKALAEEIGVNVNFFRADILNYKIEKNFDVIYSSGVMQCVPPNERPRVFKMLQSQTKVGGLNALSVFVDKSFIEPSPYWDKNEYLYNSAELFSYYGRDWKFEMMQEVYFSNDSEEKPHDHCVDIMIARKISN